MRRHAKTGQTSLFLGFTVPKKSSNLPRVVWAGEEPKTGLGFEIGPRQQKCQRSPNAHLIGNPAVTVFGNKYVLFRLTYNCVYEIFLGYFESFAAKRMNLNRRLAIKVFASISLPTCLLAVNRLR